MLIGHRKKAPKVLLVSEYGTVYWSIICALGVVMSDGIAFVCVCVVELF